MTQFRWRNCYADVAAAKHDVTIRSFLADVILPAIAALEARIEELACDPDPAACFGQSDMEDVLAETRLAFCLAVQSIWERQLRGYLKGCAGELRPGEGMERRIEKADWGGLRIVFRDLRGIELEAFPSFAELDTLHHLGNACRHGDGASSLELARRCPEWWASAVPMTIGDGPTDPLEAVVGAMTIPTERLKGLVTAVIRFWEDAGYIYNESIERKGESLERLLALERATRAWRPVAEQEDG